MPPVLHTMYADKPMAGHGLMQAIAASTASSANKARAVWLVDYLGLRRSSSKAGPGTSQKRRQRRPVTFDHGPPSPVNRSKNTASPRILLHGFDLVG